MGSLTGLSNQANATSANLATLLYNARAQVDTISFQTTSGSALASDQFGYDADLRPTSVSASWQSGSGNSGTMFSQSRVYDPASNVISLATTQAAVPNQSGSGGSESQNFCYDEQNRLVWAGNSGSQPGAGNGTSATCSNKTGQVYASSYDSWGNVTSRTYSGTTATLTYDLLDHFVSWNAGSQSKDLYVYDASGTRVLRRTTNGSGTTMTIYAFGLEEHTSLEAGCYFALDNNVALIAPGKAIWVLTSHTCNQKYVKARQSRIQSFN